MGWGKDDGSYGSYARDDYEYEHEKRVREMSLPVKLAIETGLS